MRMVFRWYGEGNDRIPLSHVKQIPGVEGIVWALHDVEAGEEWPMEKILKVKEQADRYRLHIEVVESVNVHEDIKLGLPTRDRYIENYKRTIEKLAQVGVKVICYNFMPVFDWTRTDLYKPLEDGSTALFYEKEKAETMSPEDLVDKIAGNSDFTMPGWEAARLKHLSDLFQAYKNVSEEDLWNHLQYFLEEIIPVAEENDIKMAIHPDDPPWSIFGLPRIITNKENIRRLLNLVDSPSNTVTLCSGSLGANPNNNIAEMVNEFADRIPFAHIRNVKIYENGDFIETSHRTADGSVDIYRIVKAYHDNGFTGYARPDHGRHIFDEECRPGYGLYDRALGIMYLWGIWDALERAKQEEEK
ncbi:mannonate dehydratase [Bacillus ginsengihumi]|uniref:Mannonate dehydratase n=1 Tax=Heyndrickxia ginsengihumi TaxID=363870 RepID=A0A0A6VG30_9BACI|nr:mannonate dehydratase [Heyndrickxia ginsengihumi]KHD85584.1 mannonate dehydratase [Heyndrickxia ginsengihumi]MBE6183637.1 mannonate dehydratase [Bacillus sp. (in: firmicutes)]MCM3023078.1 mannonate dehydratase [Heyndrickxia ginsengihumi]NEY19548.1 mannonate dehydratase [Heyndrickxia ginsengihumi]